MNPKEKPITIRFTTEQYNSIEKLSKDNDVSLATIVRWAVKNYIEK